MMFLSGVDPQQVFDVQSGKRKGRGCGKTIAKMIKLLSYIRYCNGNKRYLFICENREMAKNINDYFYFWIADIGLYARDHSDNDDGFGKFEYNVIVNSPIPTTFWSAIKELFRKKQPEKNIYIKFVHAGWKIQRGIKHFDEIIVDVSPDASYTHWKEISKAIDYGYKNG